MLSTCGTFGKPIDSHEKLGKNLPLLCLYNIKQASDKNRKKYH